MTCQGLHSSSRVELAAAPSTAQEKITRNGKKGRQVQLIEADHAKLLSRPPPQKKEKKKETIANRGFNSKQQCQNIDALCLLRYKNPNVGRNIVLYCLHKIGSKKRLHKWI